MRVLLLILFVVSSVFAEQTLTHATRLIKQHEGYSKHLYVDTNGYSIGYGTNLTYGITKEEASLLLKHRLSIVEHQLQQYVWYNELPINRKVVLLDMTYNIGLAKLLQFKGFIWCLKNKYWHAAANHMKSSLWYHQTGNRAKSLVYMMYYNKEQE